MQQLVKRFELLPHPEGGFYRETYRSAETVAVAGRAPRAASTAIYFLLPEGVRSALHRIKSDELWHFYLGGPLVVAEIAPDGRVIETELGSDLDEGQVPQHVVPAGHWFGAYLRPGTAFAFVGCTVAPGFDFADFEMGGREALARRFPGARDVVELLAKRP